ncbi:hypothetical protein Vretimale_13322 [Volvox reticuliferus]|uniref:Uncharacterized protein n=1 Tax=Volvox reticuliferus TaxID=1737510 RepID=A0A8J4FR77_9CHLO|nr:hypothetical protein Vretifemale_14068 [Volvox reticuliferus]GIM09465.1 hypothetical protein Vretimale_13322 [Volvox reticuliferus]
MRSPSYSDEKEGELRRLKSYMACHHGTQQVDPFIPGWDVAVWIVAKLGVSIGGSLAGGAASGVKEGLVHVVQHKGCGGVLWAAVCVGVCWWRYDGGCQCGGHGGDGDFYDAAVTAAAMHYIRR